MLVGNSVGIDMDGGIGMELELELELDRRRAVDMVDTCLAADLGTAAHMDPDVNMLEA